MDGTIDTPNISLNLLRSFFPPTPASNNDAFLAYVSGRRFAVCLTVHQRSVDVPDVDVPTGCSVNASDAILTGEEADITAGRRAAFVDRVSARRATVRVEAMYEVAS